MSRRKSAPHTAEPDRMEGSGKVVQESPDAPGKVGAKNKETLEGKLAAAEAKAQENYDRLLRVTAEFENYKKRMDREMNDFRKFAHEVVVKDLLPTVDNLQRALETPPGDNEKALDGMRKGVEMTLKGLLDTLEKHGVQPMDALNKPFDPNFHHAVMQEESEGHPENTVSQELQKGYVMNDRLIRPAMVVVSKKPAAKGETEAKNLLREHKIEDKVH